MLRAFFYGGGGHRISGEVGLRWLAASLHHQLWCCNQLRPELEPASPEAATGSAPWPGKASIGCYGQRRADAATTRMDPGTVYSKSFHRRKGKLLLGQLLQPGDDHNDDRVLQPASKKLEVVIVIATTGGVRCWNRVRHCWKNSATPGHHSFLLQP